MTKITKTNLVKLELPIDQEPSDVSDLRSKFHTRHIASINTTARKLPAKHVKHFIAYFHYQIRHENV